MWKSTPLIIFEWIQFSGRTRSSRHHKAKASWRSYSKMSLLSAPGSVLSGKISRFHARFQDFRQYFKISEKISRFHGDFKISLKISEFPEKLCRLQWEDFCKISRFQWRFLQQFMILVQILTYWFWISGWCDCTAQLNADWHSVQAWTCINQYTIFVYVGYRHNVQAGHRYLYACMHADWRQTITSLGNL